MAEREQQVRRPLGEPAHVPRIPVGAVGDEAADVIAVVAKSPQLVRANPVQHLHLDTSSLNGERLWRLADAADQLGVVRAKNRAAHPTVAELAQELTRDLDIGVIDGATRPVCHGLGFEVRALDEADRGAPRRQTRDVAGRTE